MPDDGAGVNGEDLVESNCNFSLGSSNKLKNTQKSRTMYSSTKFVQIIINNILLFYHPQ